MKTYLHLLTRPSGLILLTGPTGSGKTTAIYASLYYLVQRAGPAISISTVEDPVEFPLSMVSQAQVSIAHEFTYPRALRSLMRQDPEVIMIGEIRDPETAAIAVQAGLTGHLVISTIHSGSTAGVFARLINMDIEPFLLSSSIIGVLGVRLIRKNCQSCQQRLGDERFMNPGQVCCCCHDAVGVDGPGCRRAVSPGRFSDRFVSNCIHKRDESAATPPE